MEVIYNVIYNVEKKDIKNDEMKDILTKKLLRVILNTEEDESMGLNNS